MERKKLKDTRYGLAAASAAGVALLASCSSPAERAAANSTEVVTSASPATTTPEAAAGVTITFDDLDGGSSVINVYQGVGDSPEDRTVSGTFFDGDTATAACVIDGRMVNSDPSVGEANYSSNQWALLADSHTRMFATLVYVENSEQVAAQLPPCA